MEEVLKGLPGLGEIARMEERRQAFGVAMIAAESLPTMGGTVCWSPDAPWVNQARGVGLDGPVSDGAIDGAVGFLTERGARASVELTPFADASLVEGLAARGFTVSEFATCWAAATDSETGEDPGSRVDGVTIGVVEPDDEEMLGAWAARVSDGFFEPGSSVHAGNVAVMLRVARMPGVVCVGAFEGGSGGPGSLIGGATMEVCKVVGAGTVAGLFMASVAERHRGRGIQQAMIRDRLARAGRMGAVAACIESAPHIATGRNARRCGFVPAYTKVTVVGPENAG